MKYLFTVIASTMFLSILLSSCSTAPERRLEPAERALDTDGATTSLFHSTLYYPAEISLRFDGFIVGVEKSPRDKISSVGDVNIRPAPNAGLSREDAEKKLQDNKLLYISHIIENKGEGGGSDNCTLYNAYNQFDTKNLEQLAPPCADSLSTPIAPINAFRNSWRALDQLEVAIGKHIKTGKYSDIIVLTMGWNTDQEKAVRNFNSIISNIKATAGHNFNPLVIGVTWPSTWESDWLAPLYRLLSFPVKSADADELGLTWLGVLIHKTIPNIQGSLPVTVIGHSFGSRASSVAACVGPVIYESNPEIILAHIDNLINLQGAFLSSRLFGERDKGFHYPIGCNNVRNIVLTSSVRDSAMNSAFWGVYSGDERSYTKHCEESKPTISCARAASNGTISYVARSSLSNITYVDASELIKENAYLSGGGAHSDIYRKEHGVLINGVIKHARAR